MREIEDKVQKLPSYHQIDDNVHVLMNKQRLFGRIISVKFTDYGKVFYDISVQVNKDDDTELHDVDAMYVVSTK